IAEVVPTVLRQRCGLPAAPGMGGTTRKSDAVRWIELPPGGSEIPHRRRTRPPVAVRPVLRSGAVSGGRSWTPRTPAAPGVQTEGQLAPSVRVDRESVRPVRKDTASGRLNHT